MGVAVRPRLRALGLALVIALLPAPAPAEADALDEAKAAGWVGERNDGFIGLVRKDAPPDVRRLVKTVNDKREVVYDEIADEEGTTPVVVAARAGAKLIARAPAGHYVQNDRGDWVRK